VRNALASHFSCAAQDHWCRRRNDIALVSDMMVSSAADDNLLIYTAMARTWLALRRQPHSNGNGVAIGSDRAIRTGMSTVKEHVGIHSSAASL
jgi:hypothetical protein